MQSLTKFQGDVNQILGEVQAIKRHQTILSSELRDLQSSNRQLWQANLEDRAKHEKNQDIIDKILKFLAGVFGGRALSEGGGFGVENGTGNIRDADFHSALGLGNHGPASQTSARSNGKGENGQRRQPGSSGDRSTEQPDDSDQYGLLNAPRKRRRLLLEGSPDKPGSKANKGKKKKSSRTSGDQQSRPSCASISSQFEEIHSNDGDGGDIPVEEEMEGSGTGIRSITTSPPTEILPRFDDATEQVSQSKMNDLANIDWPAVSAYLSNTDNAFNLSDPSFFNHFSLPATSASPENNMAVQSKSPTALSFPLALSPQASLDSRDQGLIEHGANMSNPQVRESQNQENKIKMRMDSLSEAIDRLVAQLPEGFDFSSLQNGQNGISNGTTGEEDFDFSQYRESIGPLASFCGMLIAVSVDNTTELGNYSESNGLGHATDTEPSYLDPALSDSSFQQQPHPMFDSLAVSHGTV